MKMKTCIKSGIKYTKFFVLLEYPVGCKAKSAEPRVGNPEMHAEWSELY